MAGLIGIDWTAVIALAQTLGIEWTPALLGKIKALESATLQKANANAAG